MIQLAGTLTVQHHVERRTVLDAAARIEIFSLAEDLDTGNSRGILSRRIKGVLPTVASRGSASVRASLEAEVRWP